MPTNEINSKYRHLYEKEKERKKVDRRGQVVT
jgi:hypothetical protein